VRGLSSAKDGRHIVVSGQTGGGKSGLLMQILVPWLGDGLSAVVVDPKGQTAAELLAFASYYDVVRPEEIGIINFFGAHATPFDPCARVEGVDDFTRADLVVSFVAAQVDGVGQRMVDALYWAARAVISRGGSFADVPEILASDDYAARFAASVPDEEARAFLLRIGERVPAMSRSALESRIRYLTRLPTVRASLCCGACISLDQLVPHRGLVIADLGSAPSADLADAVGSLVVGLVGRAVYARRSQVEGWLAEPPSPALVVIDEAQRVMRSSAQDVEDWLCAARAYGVSVAICTQSLRNRVFDEKFVAVLRANTSYEVAFRPDNDVISDLAHMLPVTGMRRNAALPDKRLSRKEEIDLLSDQLRRLPRRHFLLADRTGARATVETLRSLQLPYEEATGAFRALPAERRLELTRGSLARPVAELLARSRPSLPVGVDASGAVEGRGDAPAARRRGLKVVF
jgi:hypothetical protein